MHCHWDDLKENCAEDFQTMEQPRKRNNSSSSSEPEMLRQYIRYKTNVKPNNKITALYKGDPYAENVRKMSKNHMKLMVTSLNHIGKPALLITVLNRI